MSLLELARVTKYAGRASERRLVLEGVSLCLDAGELVAVWGARRSGRSTLLRVAAGITRPDEGSVWFQGDDLAGPAGDARRRGIAYCLPRHRPDGWQLVLDQLVTDQLMCGMGIEEAERQAGRALTRAGAEHCRSARLGGLDPDDATRVALARALACEPKLLVVDDPTLGIEPSARDEILLLLRSIADDGTAVLITTGDAPCLTAAHRRLWLDAGQLRGNPSLRLAQVLPLRRSA